MRRRTGARARAMLDITRWCKEPTCPQPPAHTGPCRPADVAEEMRRIVEALARTRFRYANEIDLHEGISALLTGLGIPAGSEHREVCLSARDRIDFLLPSGIGIEVKVDSTPGDVWRQLRRYATCPRVHLLMLITTRVRHAAGAPTSLNDKPIAIHVLRGGLR
jgi:hypothetical protein